MKTVLLDKWSALFRHYPMQTNPQPCYVELNLHEQTLKADWNAEIGRADPMSVYHGHERRYPIPCLHADTANRLLAELEPLAMRVIAGYTRHFNGSNIVAVLSADAQKAEEDIEKAIEPYWSEPCLCEILAADWWYTCPPEINAATTDEELEAMADEADAECAAENSVLTGALEYLQRRRVELQVTS